MSGLHKGVSTQRTTQQTFENPAINPQKETNRPGTGYKIKPKLKAMHTYN